MASQPNARADVISIGSSSSDESEGSYSPPSPPRKRLRADGNDDDERDSQRNRAASRNPKRAKIDSDPSDVSSPEASGSEDGEIDESGHHGAALNSEDAAAPRQSHHVTSQQPELTRNVNEVMEHAETTANVEPSGDSLSQASMPPTPVLFNHENLSLKLPILSQKREGSWPSRFKDWAHLFCTSNADHVHLITPVTVRAAFTYFIDQVSGLKRPKKKSARLAASQIEKSGVLMNIVRSAQTSVATGLPPAGLANGTAPGPNANSTAPKGNAHEVGNQNQAQGADSTPTQNPETKEVIQQNTSSSSVSNGADMDANPSGTHPAVRGQPSDEPIVIRRENLPLGTDALEQQRRYFPSASDPSDMCLLCGRQGHAATNCTDAACKFCGSLEHWHFSCPTRVRCGKCRQLGHGTSHCVEKLALTKDEGLACSFCSSPDHAEKDCTEVWRSFHPDASTVHPVVFIPPSCAMCGSGDHYSADCGQRSKYARNPTWSLRNRNLYIDPNCGSVTIEDAGGARGSARVAREPEIKIRGHAARTNNVHYSESDDSEVEFLGRNAVKPRAPVGQIRMSSNIQMPQAHQAARPAQPPLPSEPPPPLPFTHPPPPGVPSYGLQRSRPPSGPPPPPSSLPAKPPAPSRDYHQVPPPPHAQGMGGQGRQNGHGNPPQGPRNGRDGGGRGRGGRGGGFRGRGRGRGGGGRGR